MASIAAIYSKTVHENLRPFYANWEPGRPLRLGDYGLLADSSFHYIGNIESFEIEFSVREDESCNTKSFSSIGVNEVKIIGAGECQGKASLEINFSEANAVYFNAANCKHMMIKDKRRLGIKIMKLYNDKIWNKSWVVISDLIKAGASTVAVSSGNSSSLVLEASSQNEIIDIANLTSELKVRSEKNVGFKIIAQKGLIPLVGLCKIQNTFLGMGKDEFNPVLYRSDACGISKDDNPDNQLYFGQFN